MIVTVPKHKQCLFSTPGVDHDPLYVRFHKQELVGWQIMETALLAFGYSDNNSIQKLRTEMKLGIH